MHGTCVAVGGQAVLLLGAPGSGKSDLALRLIDQGALLVADDYVEIERDGDDVIAQAPEAIRGMIEVRGLGVARLARHADKVPLRLVVRLVPWDEVERLPERRTMALLDILVPEVSLDGTAASTPAKIRLALGAGQGEIDLITASEG